MRSPTASRLMEQGPRSRRLALIALALLLVSVTGCGSKPQARWISADLSISAYIEARMHSPDRTASTFDFPVLEIYNDDGWLVYHGHEAIQNAAILNELPASARNLQPVRESPRLADILKAVPAFKAQERRVLEQHGTVVLSVELEGCGACRIQDRAMDEARQRLLQRSIAVLEIHVIQPL